MVVSNEKEKEVSNRFILRHLSVDSLKKKGVKNGF